MALSGKSVMVKVQKLGRSAVNAVSSAMGLSFENREALIESSQRVAVADSRFVDRVQAGDRGRDQRDWAAAEAAYASALSLYPYERTYWVQHGHMAKEQDRFERAEISYRNACALGAAPHHVLEHLRFVMARQGVDEGRFPIRFHRPGPAAGQAPAEPDAIALARLAWGVGGMADADMLRLLRENGSCDEMLAAMIRDHRFERANREWLEVVREGEL